MKMKINEISHLKTNGRIHFRDDWLIEITDVDGNVGYASDIKTLADKWGITTFQVRNGLYRGRTVRGCRLRVVDSITLGPIKF